MAIHITDVKKTKVRIVCARSPLSFCGLAGSGIDHEWPHSVALLSLCVRRLQVCEAMCCFMQWKLPAAKYLGVIGCVAAAKKVSPSASFAPECSWRSVRCRDPVLACAGSADMGVPQGEVWPHR